MRLIVGLGNPGERYVRTRHNIGAAAVERAAQRWSISLRAAGEARCGQGCIGPVNVALALPLVWMNQSGEAVKALLDALVLPADQLVLVHDDLDLDLGRLRIRPDGGHGGHNGVRSVIETLGTDQFPRVKIGIGRPAPDVDPAEYVLTSFTPDESVLLEEILDHTVEALACLVVEGPERAMNRFNVRPEPGHEDSDG